MFGGLAFVVSVDRRFRRFHLFGRFWRPDWARFRELWRLGLPIALTLAFEVTIFNASAFLMGLIGADSLAAHAIAIQIAVAGLHGAARPRHGGDGAGRPRLWPRRPGRHPPRRLDRLRAGDDALPA